MPNSVPMRRMRASISVRCIGSSPSVGSSRSTSSGSCAIAEASLTRCRCPVDISPTGRPDSVPVWFLWREDDSILVFSRPGKAKLRNIDGNPSVALGLDVTDIGRDIIRFEGTAARSPDHPPADEVPEYAAKYTERIGAIFGTVEQFAASFSEAIVITPTRLHA